MGGEAAFRFVCSCENRKENGSHRAQILKVRPEAEYVGAALVGICSNPEEFGSNLPQLRPFTRTSVAWAYVSEFLVVLLNMQHHGDGAHARGSGILKGAGFFPLRTSIEALLLG